MQLTRAIGTLGRNDARLIGRDSFLIGLIFYIVGISTFVRLALPWLSDQVAANPDIAINVPEFYPLLVSFFAIYIGALVAGIMIGFVVLDERDDHTLMALLVTPLPVNAYLLYRVLIPAAIGLVLSLVQFVVINQALIPWWQIILIAMGSSLFAAVMSLFFATFAENKVQGFALTKIIGTAGLLIFVAWFLPMPLELLCGIFPPYWFVKAYWMAHAGESLWWLPLVISIVYQLALIALLMRRFRRVAYT